MHCVGLSILSGSHMELVPDVLAEMKQAGIDDVPVIVGGIIPDRDAKLLKEMGVAAVFTPKDFSLTQAMAGIVRASATRTNWSRHWSGQSGLAARYAFADGARRRNLRLDVTCSRLGRLPRARRSRRIDTCSSCTKRGSGTTARSRTWCSSPTRRSCSPTPRVSSCSRTAPPSDVVGVPAEAMAGLTVQDFGREGMHAFQSAPSPP